MPNEHAQRRALTPLMCQHASVVPSLPYLAYRPMTDHPSHPSIRGFIPSAYSKSPMPRYQQLLPFLLPWIAANTFPTSHPTSPELLPRSTRLASLSSRPSIFTHLHTSTSRSRYPPWIPSPYVSPLARTSTNTWLSQSISSWPSASRTCSDSCTNL